MRTCPALGAGGVVIWEESGRVRCPEDALAAPSAESGAAAEEARSPHSPPRAALWSRVVPSTAPFCRPPPGRGLRGPFPQPCPAVPWHPGAPFRELQRPA